MSLVACLNRAVPAAAMRSDPTAELIAEAWTAVASDASTASPTAVGASMVLAVLVSSVVTCLPIWQSRTRRRPALRPRFLPPRRCAGNGVLPSAVSSSTGAT